MKTKIRDRFQVKLLDLRMKWIAVVSLFLQISISCNSQQEGRDFFAEKEFFNDGTQSAGLGFLHQLKDAKVYNHSRKEFSIKPPVDFIQHKTAWGLLYFPGLGKRTTMPDMFFLLQNYDSSVIQLVVDKNGNRDFTDDSLYYLQPGKWNDIEVLNQSDKGARVYYQLLFRNDIRDSSYEKLQKAMAIRPQEILPFRFMVFTKTRNFRKIILPDSNIISVCDANINGFFNDKDDRIIAGDIQKGERLYNNPLKSHRIEKDAELPFQNNTYQLIEVDKYGNRVKLNALNKVTDSTETFPGFQFTDEKGDEKEFRFRMEKEYTVFYFWGVWCIGCHVQAPAFAALVSEYKGKADFCTFNTGDKKEQMLKYLELKKFPFQQYRISKAQVEKLHVESFPGYVVINKRQQVLLRTSSVEMLAAFLRK
jgi:thiol-disulfide isomerase/thioredoxin